MYKFENGFSLLELLIVITIVVLLASIGIGYYLNYGKSVEINSSAQIIVFDLKQVQSKAMIGEGGYKWGIHFVNPLGTAKDYYEIFSTGTDYSTSPTIISTNYLPSSATFNSPGDNSSTDIIFSKISGSATAASVAITSFGFIKTIDVSSIGIISIQ